MFDWAALDIKVRGFEPLADSLKDYTPGAVAEALGIDADLIKSVATLFAKAETA